MKFFISAWGRGRTHTVYYDIATLMHILEKFDKEDKEALGHPNIPAGNIQVICDAKNPPLHGQSYRHTKMERMTLITLHWTCTYPTVGTTNKNIEIVLPDPTKRHNLYCKPENEKDNNFAIAIAIRNYSTYELNN